MCTKLDKVVTYLEELLPLKSHDLLITWPQGGTPLTKSFDPLIIWSGEVRLQIKNVISSLLQNLWPLSFAGF